MSDDIIEQMQRSKADKYSMMKQQLLSTGKGDIIARIEACVDLGIRQGSFDEDTPAGDSAMELSYWLWEKGGRDMLDAGYLISDGAFFVQCDYETAAKLSSRFNNALHRKPSGRFLERRRLQKIQDEERRRVQTIQDQRKKNGQCIMCGKHMPFFQRLVGAGTHKTCTSFVE